MVKRMLRRNAAGQLYLGALKNGVHDKVILLFHDWRKHLLNPCGTTTRVLSQKDTFEAHRG